MTPRFNLGVLLDMLTYCRPARSETTLEFNHRFIRPLPGAVLDVHGNWHVRVGDSPIVWSCHTDTVHRMPGRQTVQYDPASGMVKLSKRSKRSSSCLGADDTAGVFLCWSMIRAGIPGHYIFHFAEEIGGIGSSDLAERNPEALSGATCCIALDRRGHDSVITHQYGRTCSQAFAISLAAQLNVHGLTFKPDDSGTFTDSANYTSLVPECTNLSVGYSGAHSDREALDVHFLRRLLPALAALDSGALVIDRNVTDEEEEYGYDLRWTTLPTRDSADVRSLNRAPEILRFPPSEVCANTEVGLDVDEECYVCGYWYESRTSTADECKLYCSEECEAFDLLERVGDQRSADDPYSACMLDDTYAAVQDALRALDVRKHSRH